jgi:TPR repeat protein
MPDQIKSSARPYLRPLIVTFSALALASAFSFAAIELTEPAPRDDQGEPQNKIAGESESLEATAAETFVKAKLDAAGGDPRKLMALANCYLYGIGTAKDEIEAARLHRMGAEKKEPLLVYLYGCDLRFAIGVKKDVASGLRMIREAADKGLPEAEYAMHEILDEGEDLPADHAEARQWLVKAAEHGHHDARADLAEEILKSKDRKRARSVFTGVRPGALEGHARSCKIMGFIHSVGFGVKEDPVEAMAWRLVLLNITDEGDGRSWKIDYAGLTEADQAKAEKRAKELSGRRAYVSPFIRNPAVLLAEKKDFEATRPKAEKGDRDAQFHLAELYHFGRGTAKNEAEAARWCRKAAEQGHAEAQFNLGQTLRIGEAVSPDMQEAFEWFMKSALQGNPDAEHALSVCYQEGEGVKADKAEALKWRQQAAEHGEPHSQCNLGTDYFGDKPEATKDVLAARWFRKAAEQLHPKGGFCLGLCYLQGRGVPEDRIEGLAWMTTSADGLSPELKECLINIVDGFTEDELNKAIQRSKQLVKECQTKIAIAKVKTSQ